MELEKLRELLKFQEKNAELYVEKITKFMQETSRSYENPSDALCSLVLLSKLLYSIGLTTSLITAKNACSLLGLNSFSDICEEYLESFHEIKEKVENGEKF